MKSTYRSRYLTLPFLHGILIVLLLLSVVLVARAETVSEPSAGSSMIWMAPLPYTPWKAPNGIVYWNGSVNYYQLFNNEELWASARKAVKVFKFYGWWITDTGVLFANDSIVSTMISKLSSWGVKIAVEEGPLVPTETCGEGVEGFGGPEPAKAMLRRIKKLGGVVSYIALDEPYFYGALYSGKNACKMTPEEVARQVVTFIQEVRTIFPDVVVGDIEPVLAPGFSVEQAKLWIETYRKVAGHDLPFFHVDVQWHVKGWETQIAELENFVKQRGIDFGIIYNGDDDVSDRIWFSKAQDRMVRYEVIAKARPDHVIFQSWMDKPDYVLPEDSEDTLTHLIKLYLRQRTYVLLNVPTVVTQPDAPVVVNGLLINSAGETIPQARMIVQVKPLAGQGFYGGYAMSGTIPDKAHFAVVGFRVNTECDCAGLSEFSLYNVTLMQGLERQNLVPNHDFSMGLEGWGLWGNGTASLEPSDMGRGNMLHVQADKSTFIALNSQPIPVNGGLNYTVIFGARVRPYTFESGYFAIMFLRTVEEELRRDTVDIETVTKLVGEPSTDEEGFFSQTWAPQTMGDYVISVYYGGSSIHWPSYSDTSSSTWSSAVFRLDAAYDQLKKQIELLQSEINKLQTHIESLGPENDQLKIQIDRLDRQVKTLALEKTELENRLRSAAAEIDKTQIALRASENEIATLRAQLPIWQVSTLAALFVSIAVTIFLKRKRAHM